MSSLDALALLLPCPACGAEPSYWCVTYRPTSRPAGMVTVWLHQPRMFPVQEAWRRGYHEGEWHVVAMIDAVASPDNRYADQAWLDRFMQRIRDRAAS